MLTRKTMHLYLQSHTTHLPKKLHLTHKSLNVNESPNNFGVLAIQYTTPQQLH
jgi:hypothetical protein